MYFLMSPPMVQWLVSPLQTAASLQQRPEPPPLLSNNKIGPLPGAAGPHHIKHQGPRAALPLLTAP